jgi:hypothetical protein
MTARALRKSQAEQLITFRDDCHALDAGSFRVRHGDAFLLHQGSLAALEPPGTVPEPTLALEDVRVSQDDPGPQWNFLVFPVRRRDRMSSVHFVSIGRAENNDIVIPDRSVSIFHAFFVRRLDGRYALQDAHSKNGTFVDDQRVPTQGKGEPVAAVPGSRIRIGGVELTFLPSDGFHQFVRSLART